MDLNCKLWLLTGAEVFRKDQLSDSRVNDLRRDFFGTGKVAEEAAYAKKCLVDVVPLGSLD